jgi:hypothetical protein
MCHNHSFSSKNPPKKRIRRAFSNSVGPDMPLSTLYTPYIHTSKRKKHLKKYRETAKTRFGFGPKTTHLAHSIHAKLTFRRAPKKKIAPAARFSILELFIFFLNTADRSQYGVPSIWAASGPWKYRLASAKGDLVRFARRRFWEKTAIFFLKTAIVFLKKLQFSSRYERRLALGNVG